VDPARNHRMQRARRIDSRFSWHDPYRSRSLSRYQFIN
jgi:hypothetical protein